MRVVTAQVADNVELDGQMYDVAGVRGGPLFDPAAHRIKPGMLSTACWRGYICWYSVMDSSLRLVRLVVGEESRMAGRKVSSSTTLLGRSFAPTRSWPAHGWEVAGLDMLIPITGSLLVGQGFIQSTYVHMGFHPAWKFETVIELSFENGAVTAARDRSGEVAAFRQRLESGAAADPDGPRGGTSWVERTFSLDYSRSLPNLDT
jgi:hypothetical protein